MLTIAISPDRLELLQHGAVIVPDRPAQFVVTGPGALECVQGVLTNDVVKPGPNSLVYGALLTPKGMIIADCWVLAGAAEEGLLILAAGTSEAHLAGLFRRQFPPRVAKVANLTATGEALYVLGQNGTGLMRERLGGCPDPGRVAPGSAGGETIRMAAPVNPRAPFRVLVTGSPAGCRAAAAELAGGGAVLGTPDDMAAARVITGFPGLGAEIDDRTMPAEVDYGGIAGVSHSKGCYVGQETVARLHFRGHANWLLRRIRSAPGTEIPSSGELVENDKVVARIGTILRLDDGSSLGLAKVRREIEPGSTIAGVVIESYR